MRFFGRPLGGVLADELPAGFEVAFGERGLNIASKMESTMPVIKEKRASKRSIDMANATGGQKYIIRDTRIPTTVATFA